MKADNLSGFHMRKIRNTDGSVMLFGDDSSPLDHEKYLWRYETGKDIDASMPGAPLEIRDSRGALLGSYADQPKAKPMKTVYRTGQLLDSEAARREADAMRSKGVPGDNREYKGGTQVADLTVTVDPHAVAGEGHVDVRVNDGSNYGFFPNGGTKIDQGRGQDVPGHVKKTNTSDYHPGVLSHTIKTTPEQDAKVRAFIEARIKDPGWYNLYKRNCLKFVQEAFRAAGIDTRDDEIGPLHWFRTNFEPREWYDPTLFPGY
jgi:hypothetical protein